MGTTRVDTTTASKNCFGGDGLRLTIKRHRREGSDEFEWIVVGRVTHKAADIINDKSFADSGQVGGLRVLILVEDTTSKRFKSDVVETRRALLLPKNWIGTTDDCLTCAIGASRGTTLTRLSSPANRVILTIHVGR